MDGHQCAKYLVLGLLAPSPSFLGAGDERGKVNVVKIATELRDMWLRRVPLQLVSDQRHKPHLRHQAPEKILWPGAAEQHRADRDTARQQLLHAGPELRQPGFHQGQNCAVVGTLCKPEVTTMSKRTNVSELAIKKRRLGQL